MSTDTLERQRCTRCGQEKTTSEFPVDRSRTSGHHPWCRSCKSSSGQLRYLADRERFVRSQRRYRARHLEEVRAANRTYLRRVRQTEEYRSRRRTYKRRLTAARRISNAVRSLRLRTKRLAAKGIIVTGVLTISALRARLAYFGWRCWVCGAAWQHIDHVIPLSRGGSNWPANIRPACERCNRSRR